MRGRDGAIRYDAYKRRHLAVMEFDEQALYDIAQAFPSTDLFAEDCLRLAGELHRRDHPEEDE